MPNMMLAQVILQIRCSQGSIGLQFISQTRAGVYETLCPKHMLAPDSNLEMIPNLDEAQICKGS